MSNPTRVVVVGSLNIDYIALVERLPAAGETIAASGLIQRFGGKGANQAVAAARQGAHVSIVGRVGADDNGRAYLRRLRLEGIDTRAVGTTKSALTGTALIAVDARGENLIVVGSGANAQLSAAHVRAAAALLQAARAVLLQFEIPLAAVLEAVRLAARANVPVIVNPSPWRDGFPWGKWQIDTVIANTLEAKAIFGIVPSGPSSAKEINSIRERLKARKISNLVITRGSRSTLCIAQEQVFSVPVLKVKPVDTVGAGDAFAGTYAAMRAKGIGLEAALRLANCAGALATLKRGAQESIPNRAATQKAEARLP